MTKDEEIKLNKWLQSRLTSHGYPCGLIDGVFGPTTKAALIAFQKDHKLAATGTLTDETTRALRASTSALAPQDQAQIPNRNLASASESIPKHIWPTQADVRRFYGEPGSNLVKVKLPFPMKLSWDMSTKITAMSLHAKVADSAQSAFNEIAGMYDEGERAALGIDIFGGAFNIRNMRGGANLSMHAWGIAIDFDPVMNQLKWGRDRARLARPEANKFWEAWEKRGWVSLGRARNFDWMHVQAARL